MAKLKKLFLILSLLPVTTIPLTSISLADKKLEARSTRASLTLAELFDDYKKSTFIRDESKKEIESILKFLKENWGHPKTPDYVNRFYKVVFEDMIYAIYRISQGHDDSRNTKNYLYDKQKDKVSSYYDNYKNDPGTKEYFDKRYPLWAEAQELVDVMREFWSYYDETIDGGKNKVTKKYLFIGSDKRVADGWRKVEQRFFILGTDFQAFQPPANVRKIIDEQLKKEYEKLNGNLSLDKKVLTDIVKTSPWISSERKTQLIDHEIPSYNETNMSWIGSKPDAPYAKKTLWENDIIGSLINAIKNVNTQNLLFDGENNYLNGGQREHFANSSTGTLVTTYKNDANLLDSKHFRDNLNSLHDELLLTVVPELKELNLIMKEFKSLESEFFALKNSTSYVNANQKQQDAYDWIWTKATNIKNGTKSYYDFSFVETTVEEMIHTKALLLAPAELDAEKDKLYGYIARANWLTKKQKDSLSSKVQNADAVDFVPLRERIYKSLKSTLTAELRQITKNTDYSLYLGGDDKGFYYYERILPYNAKYPNWYKNYDDLFVLDNEMKEHIALLSELTNEKEFMDEVFYRGAAAYEYANSNKKNEYQFWWNQIFTEGLLSRYIPVPELKPKLKQIKEARMALDGTENFYNMLISKVNAFKIFNSNQREAIIQNLQLHNKNADAIKQADFNYEDWDYSSEVLCRDVYLPMVDAWKEFISNTANLNTAQKNYYLSQKEVTGGATHYREYVKNINAILAYEIEAKKMNELMKTLKEERELYLFLIETSLYKGSPHALKAHYNDAFKESQIDDNKFLDNNAIEVRIEALQRGRNNLQLSSRLKDALKQKINEVTYTEETWRTQTKQFIDTNWKDANRAEINNSIKDAYNKAVAEFEKYLNSISNLNKAQKDLYRSKILNFEELKIDENFAKFDLLNNLKPELDLLNLSMEALNNEKSKYADVIKTINYTNATKSKKDAYDQAYVSSNFSDAKDKATVDMLLQTLQNTKNALDGEINNLQAAKDALIKEIQEDLYLESHQKQSLIAKVNLATKVSDLDPIRQEIANYHKVKLQELKNNLKDKINATKWTEPSEKNHLISKVDAMTLETYPSVLTEVTNILRDWLKLKIQSFVNLSQAQKDFLRNEATSKLDIDTFITLYDVTVINLVNIMQTLQDKKAEGTTLLTSQRYIDSDTNKKTEFDNALNALTFVDNKDKAQVQSLITNYENAKANLNGDSRLGSAKDVLKMEIQNDPYLTIANKVTLSNKTDDAKNLADVEKIRAEKNKLSSTNKANLENKKQELTEKVNTIEEITNPIKQNLLDKINEATVDSVESVEDEVNSAIVLILTNSLDSLTYLNKAQKDHYKSLIIVSKPAQELNQAFNDAKALNISMKALVDIKAEYKDVTKSTLYLEDTKEKQKAFDDAYNALTFTDAKDKTQVESLIKNVKTCKEALDGKATTKPQDPSNPQDPTKPSKPQDKDKDSWTANKVDAKLTLAVNVVMLLCILAIIIPALVAASKSKAN
ncbi:GA module protein [Metamycoplasma subdolum]|uniref:GA module protein n=1 Tax=Metamycoplasma subdolum TaxID=92407 RepID=A0A3L9ZX89_9BACT|nr:GA module-containing protein [Metamycoplasma subdolum]RMA77491.1 GA module protein [Metamycoplasma subdolum]WPB50690.1 GA module-containing protein [Metamycoplasma subdolum]